MKTNTTATRKCDVRIMNFATIPPADMRSVPFNRPRAMVCSLLFAVGCLAPCCPGQIPEPDNLIYGQIAIGTNLVTAQRTNVVIEVRNTEGLLLSTYRMGQDSGLGDFYAVAINFWSPGEAISPVPSPTGQTRNILVNEQVLLGGQVATLTRYQTNFLVADRGYVKRIDFGAIDAGTSGFNAWAGLYGLAPGSQNLDADGDGFTNGREFVAGTNPNDPNSLFAISITQSAENVAVAFVARRAAGTGYAGVGRLYSLLAAEDPQGPWTPLPDCHDVPGDDQTHICVMSATNGVPRFYRGTVDLR